MAILTLVFIMVISVINFVIEVTPIPSTSNTTKAHVVGSLLTFCGSPVLYSSVIPHIPLDMADNNHRVMKPEWQTDWNTECLKNQKELLNYCRQRFANTSAHLNDVLLAPIRVPLHLPTWNLPGKMGTAKILKLQPYWCLAGGSPNENLTVHRFQSPAHHLPTLLDVHRAFFSERFHQLDTQLGETVGSIVNQLMHNVEKLASLREISPQQTRHLTSDLLQSAHQQLKTVWSANEIEWSKLEHDRHADVSAQLESEDIAGEQEFAYVLQESGATTDRLQTALARLLAGIAASVNEEVGHLKKVLEHQPTTLHLTFNNTKDHWSSQVTRYVTSLDEVHAVLLKLVKQATVAINILRTRMRNDHPTGLVSSFVPHAHHFQPTLVATYNGLQTELKEARRYLLLAKQRVITELTRQSQSLVQKLRATEAHLTDKKLNSNSFVSVSDPWGVLNKHWDDLAYVEFMVYHVLTNFPKNRSHWGNFSDSQLVAWNEVWRPKPARVVKLTPEQMTHYQKVFVTSFIYGFLTAFKILAIAFCVCVGVLLVCAIVYLTRRKLKRQVHTPYDQLVARWRHTAKHWLAGTWIGPPRKVDSSVANLSHQNQSTSAVIDQKPPVQNIRGYSNPIC